MFGKCNTAFDPYSASTDRALYPFSNDAIFGYKGTPDLGWHVDMVYQKTPASFVFFHPVEVPREGNTGGKRINIHTIRR